MNVTPTTNNRVETVPLLAQERFPTRAFAIPAAIVLCGSAAIYGSAHGFLRYLSNMPSRPELVFFEAGGCTDIAVRKEHNEDAIYFPAFVTPKDMPGGGTPRPISTMLRHTTRGGTEELPLPENFQPYKIITATIGGQESLYVIGAQVGPIGKYTTGIFRFSGAEWTQIGATDTTVLDVIEWNGKLVAAGMFSKIESKEAECLAAWDGTTWKALANVTGPDRKVSCIAQRNGELLIGGMFESVDGVTCQNVALLRTDGKWAQLGDGLPSRIRGHGGVGQVLFLGDAPVARMDNVKIPGAIPGELFGIYSEKTGWEPLKCQYAARGAIFAIMSGGEFHIACFRVTDAQRGTYEKFSIIDGTGSTAVWKEPQDWRYPLYGHLPITAAAGEKDPNALYILMTTGPKRTPGLPHYPPSEGAAVQKIMVR